MRGLIFGVLFMTGYIFQGCSEADPFPDRAPVEQVSAELTKLAPVALETDLAGLSEGDRKALAKLVQAGKEIDELFLQQVDPANPELRRQLQETGYNEHLALFTVMSGRWNSLMENQPFLDHKPKPPGAGFYPEEMTREEFEQALKEQPENAQALKSEFTVIRRQNGKLEAVPYHSVYTVDKVVSLLRQAAQLTDDPSLAKFLDLRAQAFLTDDYFESDMAWMDLSGDLEIVIGPYEVYVDAMNNYKASYEAFICRVDHEESQKLATVAGYLKEMETALPIPDAYKNFNRGASSPIKVVNELFSAGDTKAGVQTTAFNLPNDERVREAKGSKKVMLKNIARAKYDQCWIPIVNTVLAPEPLRKVSFDAYFNHVLMHEMSHGLGPGNITLKNGVRTSVGNELKELYSTIEECKADVLGMYTLKFLTDKGVFSAEMETSMYASYLGGMFRSIRFGINEAHGGGVAIQFNYLMEKGAFFQDENGRLNYNLEKFWPALTELSATLLTLEAEGDYNGASALIEKYRRSTPLMEHFIEALKDVPVDIRPSYPIEDQLKDLL